MATSSRVGLVAASLSFAGLLPWYAGSAFAAPSETPRDDSASPAPNDSWGRRHGVYFRLGGGPIVGWSEYASHEQLPTPTRGTRYFNIEETSTHVGGAIEVGLGYGFVRGLALALVGSVSLEDAEYGPGRPHIEGIAHGQLMLATDYYPDPRGPWNLVVLAGFAGTGFQHGETELESYSDASPSQQGVVAAAGGGYAFSGPMSLESRLFYVRTRDELGPHSSELTLFGIQVLAVVKDF